MSTELPVLKRSTAQPQALQASMEDAERLLVATHLLHGWIWETDTEHRFTYLSDSVLTYTGRPPEWHYGRKRQELQSYYIEHENLEKLQDQLTNREPFGPFVYQRTNEGETYWVRSLGSPRYDEQGRFLGYRGVAQDVTAEMSARASEALMLEELDLSECLLRATIDCFPSPVSVFDNKQRLIFANAHYYSLLDLPASQLPIGTLFADIIALLADRGEVYGVDADDAIAKQLAMVNTGEVHRYQRTRPNGIRIEITVTPLLCGGFIKTYANVTENLELKAKLSSVVRELELERAKRNATEFELERISRTRCSHSVECTANGSLSTCSAQGCKR